MTLKGIRYLTYNKEAQTIIEEVIDHVEDLYLATLRMAFARNYLLKKIEDQDWSNYSRSQFQRLSWRDEIFSPSLMLDFTYRSSSLLRGDNSGREEGTNLSHLCLSLIKKRQDKEKEDRDLINRMNQIRIILTRSMKK